MNALLKLPFTNIKFTGSNLVFVGSRPGMGRTQYLLQLIKQNTHDNKEHKNFIVYFPFQRKSVIESKLNKNGLSGDKNVIVNFMNCDSYKLLIDTIRNDINLFSPAYIIIDGLEKIATPSKNNVDFNDLVKSLYLITEDFDIPIICSAYLDSSLDERFGGNYPRLIDFNSSAIELFGDFVLGLYRPSYYGFEEDEEGNKINDQASLFVLKSNDNINKRYNFHYDESQNIFYNQ